MNSNILICLIFLYKSEFKTCYQNRVLSSIIESFPDLNKYIYNFYFFENFDFRLLLKY